MILWSYNLPNLSERYRRSICSCELLLNSGDYWISELELIEIILQLARGLTWVNKEIRWTQHHNEYSIYFLSYRSGKDFQEKFKQTFDLVLSRKHYSGNNPVENYNSQGISTQFVLGTNHYRDLRGGKPKEATAPKTVIVNTIFKTTGYAHTTLIRIRNYRWQ